MKHLAVRKTATLGILLFAVSLPAQGADDCAEWKRGFAVYEDEVEKAIQDEPEDLPKELRRHAKAVANGYTDQAEKIDRKIRGGLSGLQAINPHPDMAGFHVELLACYRNGVAALDSEQRGDGSGRHAAEISTWQAFRRMIVSVRDLLAEHGCDPEEVDAFSQEFLPQIDAEIAALKDGTGRAPSR